MWCQCLEVELCCPSLSQIVANRWTGGGFVERITLDFSLVSSLGWEVLPSFVFLKAFSVASTPLSIVFFQGGDERDGCSKTVS